MTNLPATIFALLRQMDAEASVRPDGVQTGLNWYGAHFEPQKKRPRTEVAWSKRLGELLPLHGYPTRTEVPYPDSPRLKCDDVVTLPDGGTFWLEVKGAWKQYWVDQGGIRIYRSYLLHPLVLGLDQSKTHTVPLDIRKLDPLRPPHANYAGVLLVGFEKADNPMDADVAELVHLAGLDKAPWTTSQDRWPDTHRPAYNVRCWLWHRPVVEPDAPKGEVVLGLGVEGGGSTILRIVQPDGQVQFHVESSSMDFDENDDEVWRQNRHGPFASIEDVLRWFSSTGSWVCCFPTKIHSDFKAMVWKLAQEAAVGLTAAENRHWERRTRSAWNRKCRDDARVEGHE